MLIDIPTLLAFSIASFALVVTPGPDTMLILHRSVAGSKGMGLATVAGVQMGLVFHTFLAVLGISVIIASSPIMFKVVAILGAGYLLWLSIRSFMNSGETEFTTDDRRKTKSSAFVDSMLCNILNPKVILMYLALMPNFIVIELGNVEKQLLILGTVMIFINTVWQVPLSIAAHSAARFLKSPAIRRYIDIASGMVLALFAVFMFYENIILQR